MSNKKSGWVLTNSKGNVSLDREAIYKERDRLTEQIQKLDAERKRLNDIPIWEIHSSPTDKYPDWMIRKIWEYGLGMVYLGWQWNQLTENQKKMLQQEFPSRLYGYPQDEITDLKQRGFIVDAYEDFYELNPYAEW